MDKLWLPAISHTLPQLEAVLRYLAIVASDGDYLNDWITHIPATIQPSLIVVGQWLASLMS